MAAGYFKLEHTDAPLDYLYEYDEMKVVLDGEFRLENLDTGQVEIARARDAIFFPKLADPVHHARGCACVLRRPAHVRPPVRRLDECLHGHDQRAALGGGTGGVRRWAGYHRDVVR